MNTLARVAVVGAMAGAVIAAGVESRTPRRSVTGGVPAQERTFCGMRIRGTIQITGERVGPVEIGMAVGEVLALCPGAVRRSPPEIGAVVIQVPVDSASLLLAVVEGFGGPVPDEDSLPITSLRALGPAFSTDRGLLAGATLASHRRQLGPYSLLVCGDRPSGARFPRLPLVVFVVGPLCRVTDDLAQPRRSASDTLRVTGFEVFMIP